MAFFYICIMLHSIDVQYEFNCMLLTIRDILPKDDKNPESCTFLSLIIQKYPFYYCIIFYSPKYISYYIFFGQLESI